MNTGQASMRQQREAGRRSQRQGGFTLVELILVMVIIGIIAAVAGSRFVGTQAFDDLGARGELAAALRYAQRLAIAGQCPVTVSVSAGSYSLSVPSDNPGSADTCDGPAVAVRDPVSGAAYQGQTPPGLVATVRFNALGQPELGGGTLLTVGGRQLRVEDETGYVYLP